MRAHVVLAALVLAAITGCINLRVTSDHDPSADFTGLETWGWEPGRDALPRQPRTRDADARIRAAIEAELTRRGFRKFTDDRPDFYVNYDAALHDRRTSQTSRTQLGWSSVRTYQWVEGTLTVDVFHPTSRVVIWRGTADGAVDEKAPLEERQARLEDAVRRMFDRFPPK